MKNHVISDVHNVLREKTQIAHKQVEKTAGMQLLMSSRLTPYAYFSILNAWRHWCNINESNITKALADFSPVDIPKLSRGDLLALDLRQAKNVDQLIRPINVLPLCLHNKYEALGALYVLEGSTLGGQIIVKRLKSILGPHLSHHFYTGYGEYTYPKWNNFMTHLSNCLAHSHPQNVQLVIDGAIKTFDSISTILDQDVFTCTTMLYAEKELE